MIRRRRLGRNEHGEPVLVIEVTGVHDIYRFAHHLTTGQCEFARAGQGALTALCRRLGRDRYRGLSAFFQGDAQR